MMSIKSKVRKFAATLGYDINRKHYPAHSENVDFDALLAQVATSTMLPRARLVSLYEQVAHCQRSGIAGALVECGVWRGGAVGLMALAVQSNPGPQRTLHLFDSFQDICAPDPQRDGQTAMRETEGQAPAAASEIKPMVGFYDDVGGHGTLHACQELLEQKIGYAPSLIKFHTGWFQDTVPTQAAKIGPIAVLRLDGDWYASTKVCLDHMYDQVSDGGFIIIDDYGTYDGCRLAVDEFFSSRQSHPFLNRVDASCYYLIK